MLALWMVLGSTGFGDAAWSGQADEEDDLFDAPTTFSKEQAEKAIRKGVAYLKAVQKDPGDDYAFADPAVQRALRIQVWDQKVRQLRLRQQRHSSGQVHIRKVGSLHPRELR